MDGLISGGGLKVGFYGITISDMTVVCCRNADIGTDMKSDFLHSGSD